MKFKTFVKVVSGVRPADSYVFISRDDNIGMLYVFMT